jgi:hypothetical protein
MPVAADDLTTLKTQAAGAVVEIESVLAMGGAI